MKTKDKNNVIAILAAHYNSLKAKYKSLVQCFLKLPGATPAQKRYYNASTFSKVNLQTLEYDIKKLCNIKDKEINQAVKLAVVDVNDIDVVPSLPVEATTVLEAINLETADYNEHLKPLAKLIEEHSGKSPKDKKKVTLIAYLKEFIPKGPDVEQLKSDFTDALQTAPEEAKKGLKIRELYPFLNDDDCPDEYHTLTGKMVSAYINWKEGRKETKALIAQGVSDEEIFELAKKTVENFELNLDCHDELAYYQEHKQILGEHPIFADKMLQEKVNKMSQIDLSKRQKNLRSYISRDEKTLDKMEAGEARKAFAVKVAEWKKELDLVDTRLKKIKDSQKL